MCLILYLDLWIHVFKFYRQQLQTALTAVGQATTECRGPLEVQAGFVSAVQKARLEKILQLKNTVCPNYDSGMNINLQSWT